MTIKEYDLVVLGGSVSGYYTALRAAENGLKTAIIEENRLGGLSTLASALPAEMLIDNDSLLMQAAVCKGEGLTFEGAKFDSDDFFDAYQKRAEELSNALVKNLKQHGVDIYLGHGVVRPDHTGFVTRENTRTRLFAWKDLVYAGGAVTDVPSKISSSVSGYYTTENFGLMTYKPRDLIIYGSGAPACQAALIWAGLGTRVSLLCPDARLVPDIDAAGEAHVLETLENRGVQVYTNCVLGRIFQDSGEAYHVEFKDDGRDVSLSASDLMVMTRQACRLGGLEAMNVEVRGGWISTDDTFKTSLDHVYTWTGSAAGHTYSAPVQASRYLADHIAGKAAGAYEAPAAPRVVAVNPPYAEIGHKRADALTGSTSDGKTDVTVCITPELGEICFAQATGPKAKAVIDAASAVMNLEGSVRDLEALPLAGAALLGQAAGNAADAAS